MWVGFPGAPPPLRAADPSAVSPGMNSSNSSPGVCTWQRHLGAHRLGRSVFPDRGCRSVEETGLLLQSAPRGQAVTNGVQPRGQAVTNRVQPRGQAVTNGVQRLQTGGNAGSAGCSACGVWDTPVCHPARCFGLWPQNVAGSPGVWGCVPSQQLWDIPAETDPRKAYLPEPFV